MICWQVLFAASIIILAEKVLLQFVAIRFHREALAVCVHVCSLCVPISCRVKDRLAENKLALKALDRLSNAQPTSSKRLPHGRKKGHFHKPPSASVSASRSTSYDALNSLATPGDSSLSAPSSAHGHFHQKDAAEMIEKDHQPSHLSNHLKLKNKRRQRKAMTSVILDQLGDAIGAVALKNSNFNQRGEFGSLHSARKLARQLFATLSDVHPPRNLIVSGVH